MITGRLIYFTTNLSNMRLNHGNPIKPHHAGVGGKNRHKPKLHKSFKSFLLHLEGYQSIHLLLKPQ